MGIAKWLGLGDAAAKPIEAIGGALDELFTSDDERLTHEEVILRLKQQPALAQAAINKAEAQSRFWLTATWRPAIGWVCALGLANTFIVNPWIEWGTCLVGECVTGPEIPLSVMMELVLALLGLGALRTYEKQKGLTK